MNSIGIPTEPGISTTPGDTAGIIMTPRGHVASYQPEPGVILYQEPSKEISNPVPIPALQTKPRQNNNPIYSSAFSYDVQDLAGLTGAGILAAGAIVMGMNGGSLEFTQ